MSFLAAYLVKAPLVILATILYGSVGILVSFFDHDGSRQMEVARAWGRMLLRIAGVRVTVEGRENIHPGCSYVLASNHVSYMDTPVILGNIPVQFRFLAKKGLFDIPFLGSHLQRAGHIPVYRDDPRAAVKTMGMAADAIRERNISLLVFPEGGRTEDGQLREFKDGAAYMAIKAGAPIVPIALVGTRGILAMHSTRLRGGEVTLRIGKPLVTAGLKMKDRGAVTDTLHNQIAGLIEK